MTPAASPPPSGRSPAWRLGAAAAGIAFLAAGTALAVWPALLAWVAAVAFGGVGLLLIASAVLARGRRPVADPAGARPASPP